MSEHSIRRYLTFFAAQRESLTFRAIVVATFTVVAAIIVFQPPTPSPPVDIRLEQPRQDARNDQDEKPSYVNKLLDPISLFTLAVAVSTILLWRSTERLAKLAAREGEDTRIAAEAAQKSAEVAERALIDIERPFVFCAAPSLIPPPTLPFAPDSEFIFQCEWRNSGKTWTVEARTHVSWCALPTPLDDSYDFPNLGDPKPGEIFIGPGAPINGGPLKIPARWVVPAIQQNGHLYIYGWCEYDDIFQGTSRHRTEFCFEVVPVFHLPDRPDGLHESAITFLTYRRHNGADGDCLKPIQTGSRKNPLS